MIWQRAIIVGYKLIDISEKSEELKRVKFAEQLRGAALSVSNNIAEGSGSNSTPDFKRFLKYAHRSIFENANTILVLNLILLVSDKELADLLEDLDVLVRMISSFSWSLKLKSAILSANLVWYTL